jgi:histone deacetylase 1/2
MRMTHELATAYGMLEKMHVLVSELQTALFILLTDTFQKPKRASPEAMTAFHTDEYIHFLSSVTPETVEKMQYQRARCMFLYSSSRKTLLTRNYSFGWGG